MNLSSRVIRGADWAADLQLCLDTGQEDTMAWMADNTRLLKSDANSAVGLLQMERGLCCLKLYRHKSAVQRALFRSGHGRPVRSFEMGSAMADAGLPVARPRACLLYGQDMLLLSAGIPDAVNLQALWQKGLDDARSRKLLLGTALTLARLHQSGFAHGDCKWPNLLWSGGQCWLVDLDAAAKTAPGSARQMRDLARFILNAEELGVSPAHFELFMQHYLEQTGLFREPVISKLMPVLRKLRARHLARYGERGAQLL